MGQYQWFCEVKSRTPPLHLLSLPMRTLMLADLQLRPRPRPNSFLSPVVHSPSSCLEPLLYTSKSPSNT
ncbi:hypothetical protein OF83DRAFT_896213 [Amylostereum chailletii]|nr:hypothetical protein OF83DRAFT_896213 [Amylostereum chailletii]